MNFIVVGCGRVGAELSFRLFQNGHQVVVVDNTKSVQPPTRTLEWRTTEGAVFIRHIIPPMIKPTASPSSPIQIP